MNSRSSRVIVSVLALGHGVTDLYANFLPALLPVFQDKFHLSKTLIGGLIFSISTSGSLCQVIFGYLGDRWGRRIFLVSGPAIAAIFLCFIGLSPSFFALLALLILGGMGVSAFHPHAASFTGSMSGSKRGFNLSIFMSVGTFGYAAGPLVAAALISSRLVGPARLPLASIAGIVTTLLLYRYAVPSAEYRRQYSSIKIVEVIRPHLKPLSLLSTVVILRAAMSIVFVNFTSLLMNQRGWSLIIGGSFISLFVLFTALGTLLGGYLYDRMDRKKLLIFSLLISSPLLLAMVYSNGIVFIMLLSLSGLAIGCSNTVPLAISQELIPEGASTASSIMMGFSWGVAGVLAWLFGILADLFGGDVAPAMSIAAFLPILSALAAIPLPRK